MPTVPESFGEPMVFLPDPSLPPWSVYIDSHESCFGLVGAQRDSHMGFLFRMNRCHGGKEGAPTLGRLWGLTVGRLARCSSLLAS